MKTVDINLVLDVISSYIEMCDKSLCGGINGRDRYAVEVERNTLLKLKDDIKMLPKIK